MMNRKDEISVILTGRQLCLLSVLLEKDIESCENLLHTLLSDSELDKEGMSYLIKAAKESYKLLQIIDDARDSIFN